MRWLRISVYIGATILTIFYWTFSIALIALSSPRLGETRLAVTSKLTIVIATEGMAVDILLLVLPLVAVYRLQLRNTRRIGLTIMFSTGLMLVSPD